MTTSRNAADVRRSLDLASGELHPSAISQIAGYNRSFWDFTRGGLAQARDAEAASVAALASLAHPRTSLQSRPLMWFQGGYGRSHSRSDNQTAKAELHGPTFSVGLEAPVSPCWLVGAAFRYGDQKLKVDARDSKADVDSYEGGLYAVRLLSSGPLAPRLTLGVRGGKHDLDSRRHVGGQTSRPTTAPTAWAPEPSFRPCMPHRTG